MTKYDPKVKETMIGFVKQWRTEGKTYSQIALELNTKGYKTAGGKRFTVTGVNNLLGKVSKPTIRKPRTLARTASAIVRANKAAARSTANSQWVSEDTTSLAYRAKYGELVTWIVTSPKLTRELKIQVLNQIL